MNNKPVAWTTKKPKTVQDFSFYQTQIYTEPLYNHPANACKHGVDDGACKECYLEATHPVKELTQYDRGFDDGCKHIKKIYEVEIEALQKECEYWNKMAIERGSPVKVNYGFNSSQVKELTDEEWKLLEKVINDCADTIECRIDAERLAFKGYEHCSELEILYEEQKDASKAKAILRKAQEK